MGEETHSRHPRPQLLVDALSIGVQPALLDSAQSRGGGVGVGQNPAMELLPSSRVLLNAAMGWEGENGLGRDRTSTILSPCHLFRLF